MSQLRKILLSMIAIGCIMVVMVLFFGDYFLSQIKHWSANCPVNVTADEGLSIEKIKIEYGFMSINRESDADLFNGNYQVLFDGRKTSNLKTDYGENDFLITYDNKYYYQFRHFITNSHAFHNYSFHFTQLHDWPCVEVAIEGRDPMYFYRPLDRISDTAKHNHTQQH